MAYKRTSKKIGNIRTTRTVNTNGNITNSSSTGNSSSRVTTSWSTKNGMRQTQTYKDGAGFVHKKTLYKSTSAAERAREAKRNQKMWSNLFGGKKASRKKATNTSGIRSFFGWVTVIIIFAMVINLV